MRAPIHAGSLPSPDTSSFGLSEVLPIIIGSTGIGFGLIKVMAYSQLEVVRTAMLSRHVQQGGARVLQLGGTTRDLYYYPSGTVQVTVNAIDINKGLFQQAGMTVGVPVEATDLDLRECLQKTRDGSVDSVVSFDQFGSISSATELSNLVSEIHRVLKPGGTFVFYQRLAQGGLGQLGAGNTCHLPVGDVISENEGWDFCEWDTAAASLDAHAVGVCVKSITETVPSSVDESSFEQILQKRKKKR
ncbi:hypothetical protein M9435_006964 [Picochlorum sp. BPE23]|nr:hypothetical protein M9435_006964 [Picochlorum sp. BPE23]